MEASSMIAPELFEQLKAKIEEDAKVRQDLNEIVDELEREVAFTQGILTRVHSTPRAKYPTLILRVEESIRKQIGIIGRLAGLASNYPYYKYNQKWTRQMQSAILTVVLCAWLGGMSTEDKLGELGRLLTLDDVGAIFQVPVNLKDRDAFHITIEEYLLALTEVTDELSRLAMNSVTLGDNDMAVHISTFIKDIHAGFQLLNLKNDILRKRVDAVKYHVKKVEDVVYDLSLRNLIPAATNPEAA